ncbi:voltage-dependent calcium channel T type alpha-1H [Fistulifera solaris]|uniref:Voltage-dependent calcium channel T type alpha-1H n=1 Tax=Fistulifera solaris TaxID=1519565 RepID=A0A1Z5JV39_FISSO|nr:voltage-dependent calcium channel T type alpha-1H [Fistulifera solaris]|eukprot:GAX17910.1 voltage-dependent calcium channel T type alpha-1H [Fistulifera solaris]
MISQDLQKSSRTLIKHSSAGSFMGGWSSADLSGRSDTEDNVESSKFKSKQKLRLLMQNIEMEKKKDLVVQAAMHPHFRPLQVGELSHDRKTWRKPDLDDTLPKDAPMRRIRLMCGELVEDPRVQFFIITLIVINAIMMGVATFDFVTNDANTNMAFDIADKVFLAIFTIESALQLTYRGPSLFRDRWLVFDFVIVVISWTLESLQVIRAFRVFRALRLITRMVALKSLLMALGEVLPRIYAITSMLVLVFYIYAVLFVELFGDLQLSTNYFNTLPNALLTCMQLMTLEWSETAREVMDYYEWAGMIFCSFISITGFIVFNLIVAVVCDAVSIIDKKIRQEEEEYLEEMKHLEQHGLGLDNDESERLNDKWMEAQKRINELTLELQEMKENQTKLIAAITKLANVCQGQDLVFDRERTQHNFPSSLGMPKL